jgi:CBS domain-containing protein
MRAVIEGALGMNVGQACRRDVTTIAANADVSQAARLMLDRRDMFVVVHHSDDTACIPVGIVTDGDIVRSRTCDEGPPGRTVQDVMTCEPVTAREQDTLDDVARMMRLTGLFRVPVVDARGHLTGVLALEDALEYSRARCANPTRGSWPKDAAAMA